jgi:hypothetical protein
MPAYALFRRRFSIMTEETAEVKDKKVSSLC